MNLPPSSKLNDDPFVTCPYNKQHRVPQSRIQRHLVKCELKYPSLAICPYNATHRYPQSEIKQHVTLCPSKVNFPLDYKPYKTNAILTAPNPVLQICKEDEDNEYWD